MVIIGIDPGDERSAFVELIEGQPARSDWMVNIELLAMLRHGLVDAEGGEVLAIETLHPRGELASRQAMETQLWAGRYIEAADSLGGKWVQVAEYDSRCAVTGRTNATNSQVREALLVMFGDSRLVPCDRCHASGQVMGVRAPKKCPACKGRKSVTRPGPLHGYSEHERSALAAALWYWNKVTESHNLGSSHAR